MLIQKSVDEVKKRAEEMNEIRNSPERYNKVKSKITRNIKIQETTAKNQRKSANKIRNGVLMNGNTEILNPNGKQLQQSKSLNQSRVFATSIKKSRENPFDITEEELSKVKRTSLNGKSMLKLKERDEQIRESQQQLEDIMKDLHSTKSYQDRLSSSQNKGYNGQDKKVVVQYKSEIVIKEINDGNQKNKANQVSNNQQKQTVNSQSFKQEPYKNEQDQYPKHSEMTFGGKGQSEQKQQSSNIFQTNDLQSKKLQVSSSKQEMMTAKFENKPKGQQISPQRSDANQHQQNNYQKKQVVQSQRQELSQQKNSLNQKKQEVSSQKQEISPLKQEVKLSNKADKIEIKQFQPILQQKRDDPKSDRKTVDSFVNNNVNQRDGSVGIKSQVFNQQDVKNNQIKQNKQQNDKSKQQQEIQHEYFNQSPTRESFQNSQSISVHRNKSQQKSQTVNKSQQDIQSQQKTINSQQQTIQVKQNQPEMTQVRARQNKSQQTDETRIANYKLELQQQSPENKKQSTIVNSSKSKVISSSQSKNKKQANEQYSQSQMTIQEIPTTTTVKKNQQNKVESRIGGSKQQQEDQQKQSQQINHKDQYSKQLIDPSLSNQRSNSQQISIRKNISQQKVESRIGGSKQQQQNSDNILIEHNKALQQAQQELLALKQQEKRIAEQLAQSQKLEKQQAALKKNIQQKGEAKIVGQKQETQQNQQRESNLAKIQREHELQVKQQAEQQSSVIVKKNNYSQKVESRIGGSKQQQEVQQKNQRDSSLAEIQREHEQVARYQQEQQRQIEQESLYYKQNKQEVIAKNKNSNQQKSESRIGGKNQQQEIQQNNSYQDINNVKKVSSQQQKVQSTISQSNQRNEQQQQISPNKKSQIIEQNSNLKGKGNSNDKNSSYSEIITGSAEFVESRQQKLYLLKKNKQVADVDTYNYKNQQNNSKSNETIKVQNFKQKQQSPRMPEVTQTKQKYHSREKVHGGIMNNQVKNNNQHEVVTNQIITGSASFVESRQQKLALQNKNKLFQQADDYDVETYNYKNQSKNSKSNETIKVQNFKQKQQSPRIPEVNNYSNQTKKVVHHSKQKVQGGNMINQVQNNYSNQVITNEIITGSIEFIERRPKVVQEVLHQPTNQIDDIQVDYKEDKRSKSSKKGNQQQKSSYQQPINNKGQNYQLEEVVIHKTSNSQSKQQSGFNQNQQSKKPDQRNQINQVSQVQQKSNQYSQVLSQQSKVQGQPQQQTISKQVVISGKQSSKLQTPTDMDSPQVSSDNYSFGGLANKEKKQMIQNNQIKQGVIVNKGLDQKTSQLQNEFDQVMGELNAKRKERDGEAFYEALNEFYYGDGSEGHSSPTKRLIQHKNTTFDHKQTMKSNIEKGEYSLTYVPSPKKSYVIEPQGGELDYKLAQKNPLKFYDQVFEQDIMKYTVGKDKEKQRELDEKHARREEEAGSPLRRKKEKIPISVTQKITKRPHLKIMAKIREKIALKLKEKLGHEFGENIMAAFQDTQVDQQIKTLIKENKLKIVDNQNNPVYENEMKQGAKLNLDEEKVEGKKNVVQSKKVNDKQVVSIIDEDDLQVNLHFDATIRNMSIQEDNNAKTNTHLSIGPKDLKKIETKVQDAIRRQSQRK